MSSFFFVSSLLLIVSMMLVFHMNMANGLQNVSPVGFAPVYHLIASRNHSSLETGERYEFEAIREWAVERTAVGNTQALRRKRTECTLGDALSAVTIQIELDSWTFHPPTEYCIYLQMPVVPTNHSWMLNSTYLGETVHNDVAVYEFVKDDHYWYETVYGQQRPFGFTFPTDQTGTREGQEDFARYEIYDTYDSIADKFVIPSYCLDAKVSRQINLPDERLQCFFPRFQEP